jgi:hypothetical protein
VHRNRRRRRGRHSKGLHGKRAELAKRNFEHVLDDGGKQRVYLRRWEHIAKCRLIGTAALELGGFVQHRTGL